MDVLYPRCAGLDVHKDSVVAAVRIAATGAVSTKVESSIPSSSTIAMPASKPGSVCRPLEATDDRWPVGRAPLTDC